MKSENMLFYLFEAIFFCVAFCSFAICLSSENLSIIRILSGLNAILSLLIFVMPIKLWFKKEEEK